MSRKFWGAFAAASGLAVGIFWLQGSIGDSGPEIGTLAPDHQWTDFSGGAASLSSYRDRVVLLDFWATWCESCREELPALEKIYSKYHASGLELLAPSVDEQGRKALVPYLTRNPMPWKVLLSDSKDAMAYHVFGLPTKYLINRKGIIVRKYMGPVAAEDLESGIRTVLSMEKSD